MADDNPNPPEQPTPAAVEDKKEEIEEWRTLISQLSSEVQSMRTELNSKTGADPETQTLKDQVNRLASELEEAKGKLTAAETDLAALKQQRTAQPKSEGDGNPIPVTPKETLSDPKEVPPQTRAAKLGWIR